MAVSPAQQSQPWNVDADALQNNAPPNKPKSLQCAVGDADSVYPPLRRGSRRFLDPILKDIEGKMVGRQVRDRVEVLCDK